jgi:hypothetical protein
MMIYAKKDTYKANVIVDCVLENSPGMEIRVDNTSAS